MFCYVFHFVANLTPLWDLDCDSAVWKLLLIMILQSYNWFISDDRNMNAIQLLWQQINQGYISFELPNYRSTHKESIGSRTRLDIQPNNSNKRDDSKNLMLTIIRGRPCVLTYCGLVAPHGDKNVSHYLNQFWLIIIEVWWHWPEAVLQEMLKIFILGMSLKISNLRLQSARGNELTILILPRLHTLWVLNKCNYQLLLNCTSSTLKTPINPRSVEKMLMKYCTEGVNIFKSSRAIISSMSW